MVKMHPPAADKPKRFRPNLTDYRKATEEAAAMRARAIKAEAEHKAMTEQLAGEAAVTGPLRKRIEQLEKELCEALADRDTAQLAERKSKAEYSKLNESREACCRALSARDKEVPELQAAITKLELEVKRQSGRTLWDFLCGR